MVLLPPRGLLEPASWVEALARRGRTVRMSKRRAARQEQGEQKEGVCGVSRVLLMIIMPPYMLERHNQDEGVAVVLHGKGMPGRRVRRLWEINDNSLSINGDIHAE